MIDLRCCDNLKLMAEIPSNTIDLIYCDILYGTGRNFGDYQDLKPIRSEIESHYLPRLIEMKRVLKQNGSIYLQMDTRINHWMRILMDDVFGYDNFRNEIVWCYETAGRKSNKKYRPSHDVILFYSTIRFKFIKHFSPYYSQEYSSLNKFCSHILTRNKMSMQVKHHLTSTPVHIDKETVTTLGNPQFSRQFLRNITDVTQYRISVRNIVES